MKVSHKQQDVLEDFRAVHGELFDYSSVRYVNAETKVDIRCRRCRTLFSQRASAHKDGQGCPSCRLRCLAETKAKIREGNAQTIVSRFREVHGDDYDYTRLVYKGVNTRVEIGCRKCGRWFWSFPNNHIRGKGCQICSQQNRGQKEINTNAIRIIDEFKAVHGERYDYSRVVYSGAGIGVEIRCLACGNVFIQTPVCHKEGDGCKKCADKTNGQERKNRTAIKIIDEFVLIHGDRYDYSNVVYEGDTVKVKIECRKCGGVFLQSPGHHKGGNGCPKCKESKGEKTVADVLEGMGIAFEQQKKFNGCRSKRVLPFDFYFSIAEKEFVVEYNGRQHYTPVGIWGGDEGLEEIRARDSIKKSFCDTRKIHFIEIPHTVSLGMIGGVISQNIDTKLVMGA